MNRYLAIGALLLSAAAPTSYTSHKSISHAKHLNTEAASPTTTRTAALAKLVPHWMTQEKEQEEARVLPREAR